MGAGCREPNECTVLAQKSLRAIELAKAGRRIVTGSARIARASPPRKPRPWRKFQYISNDLLDEAFYELKENAAAGVDGLTWRDYEQNLERNLEDLHARVHRGAYRALPSRRVYIPKADGRQRPLAVAALEDKIVQRATAAVLNAIYAEILQMNPKPAPMFAFSGPLARQTRGAERYQHLG